jgi:hypothetical protein
MPSPFDPSIFNHGMGAVGDASIIALTNEILNRIQDERGIVITQEWRDAFYTLAIEAVIKADPLWTGESVATVILDTLNEPYEGSKPRSGDPIYLPPKPPEEPGFPIDIRKPPVEEESPPLPFTPPERLPNPTLPGGISPPPTSPPRTPTVRKPPVEIPPTLPPPIQSRLPEIPVTAPEPRGLSDEERKKIDDLTKKLEEETKTINEELKRLEEEQKKSVETGKPAPALDMAALAQILFESIDIVRYRFVPGWIRVIYALQNLIEVF